MEIIQMPITMQHLIDIEDIEASVIPKVHGYRVRLSFMEFWFHYSWKCLSWKSRKGTERASCTLFVNCITIQSNRREVLLSHFKKFGEVLNIHIPKISERAFVQFVSRESAKAALTSPNVVIGNRFIRLSWANRDSVLATEESSATTVTPGSIPSARTIVQTEQIHAEKGKEKVYDVAPAVSGTSTFETPTMEGSALTSVTANDLSTPSFSAVQKKQERLELLEALRQKQEMLAEKRDSFRRQLDKLEKQVSCLILSIWKGNSKLFEWYYFLMHRLV
jgi:RNA-binding protein 26